MILFYLSQDCFETSKLYLGPWVHAGPLLRMRLFAPSWKSLSSPFFVQNNESFLQFYRCRTIAILIVEWLSCFRPIWSVRIGNLCGTNGWYWNLELVSIGGGKTKRQGVLGCANNYVLGNKFWELLQVRFLTSVPPPH